MAHARERNADEDADEEVDRSGPDGFLLKALQNKRIGRAGSACLAPDIL